MVSQVLTLRLLANLRTWFYARLEPLSPARLLRYLSGDVLSRIVKDVEEMKNVYLHVVSPVVAAAIISALAFLLFYTLNPSLAFVSVASLAAIDFGVPLLVKWLAGCLGRRQLELRGELNARTVDSVQGAKIYSPSVKRTTGNVTSQR
jgi:ATP-binding cassette subfamily C protein CydC